ncbi:hypothetical protein [Actinoplanes sp. NPDC020271]|uniref:hypothetical protein n=1 Tax=Actinoplanes sp. NPDC020271 TaxID=3363896 RepID=UPI00378ADDF8
MSRSGQRVVIVAGWLVAAILAVLVGVVGIGLAGLTGRETDTVSEADVERALPRVSAAATPSAEPAAEPSVTRSAVVTKQSFRTSGGTVVADCDGILSMSPAQGFGVHETQRTEGEFRSARDGQVRVKVQLTCTNGVPSVNERGDG